MIVSTGQLDVDEVVIGIDGDSDDPAASRVAVRGERGLLENAFLCGHEEVMIAVEVLDADEGGDLLVA